MGSPKESVGVEKTVYNVPDLQPGSRYVLEIWDPEFNPVKEVEFSYIVDEGVKKTGTTDENGILSVETGGSPEKIELYLPE